ncbi:MAG: serine protease [Bacteroidales bacterium]
MYRTIWKIASPAIALLNFYSERDIKVDTLTGFKLNNYLVTDYSLKYIANYDKVEICFVDKDGLTVTATKTISKELLKYFLIKNAESKNSGFCVLNADFSEFDSIPSLKLAENLSVEIGQPVVSIGYQLDQNNLSLKRGVVSSFYERKGKRYIQFDASVKPGNAGSPLIDIESGRVIGVIGQKLAEVTQSHKKIKDIINNNITVLKKYQGRMNIEDVDPVQVLIANQNQIKYIARELYNMTNIRVGYAVPASELNHFFKKNVIMEDFKPSIDSLVNI